jgi:hypothetical protein
VTDRIALSAPSPAARSCVRLVQHRAVPSVPWSTVRGVLVLPDDVRASDPDDREGDGVGRGLREITASEAFRSLECPDVIGVRAVPVAVRIGVIVPVEALTTYAVLLSGVIAMFIVLGQA